MTLIAPSTLIALQSYTQPKQAVARTTGEAFSPLDPGAKDPIQNRDTGGVSVKLSPQAALHLGELDGSGPAGENQAQQGAALSGETHVRRDGQQPSPPAPPGSRLDIEI